MQKTEIINLALTRLGAHSISDASEASNEAGAAAKVWEVSIRATLQEFRWGFNTRRTALALAQENPMGTGYAYAYAQPRDLLQPYEIFQEDVTSDKPIPFMCEGGQVYTDQPKAILIYGAFTDVAESFSPTFCDALGWRIAMELAMPLTQKQSHMETAAQMYRQSIDLARATAGNAQRPRDAKVPHYIRIRN